MERIFAVLNDESRVSNIVVSKNQLEQNWVDVTELETKPNFGDVYSDGSFSEYTGPADPIEEKLWRDSELAATDRMAITPDWPNRDVYLLYRQALRDWPGTPEFPDTRPELNFPDIEPEAVI